MPMLVPRVIHARKGLFQMRSLVTAGTAGWWLSHAILGAYLACWATGLLHWGMVLGYVASLTVAHAELGDRP